MLGALPCQLPCPANRFAGLSCTPLGRLLVGAASFQFPEKSFALQSSLQDLERLIDIIIAN